LRQPVEYPTIENWIGRLGLPVYFALLLIAALLAGLARRRLVAGYCREASAAGLASCADDGAPRHRGRGTLRAARCACRLGAAPSAGDGPKRYLYVIAPAAAIAMILAAIVMAVEADVSTSGFALPLALVVVCGGRLDRSELGPRLARKVTRYSQARGRSRCYWRQSPVHSRT